MTRLSKIHDAIREAIESDERSRYRMANDTGIAESDLSRFVHGERGLHIDKLELLADYLGLEIIVRPKRRKIRKGR